MSNSIDQRETELKKFLERENLPESLIPLVNAALTHKSYSNEFRNEPKIKLDKHNQRLEFLGDSVLGLIVAHYFYASKRKVAEGGLTRLKSMTVCESALKLVADNLGLGSLLRMGKGEIATGGLTRTSNLADAVEALIGAIYVGASFEVAQQFVLKHFHEILENPDIVEGNQDFKSALQEYLAKKNHTRPEYQLTGSQGPDHDKEFTITLFIDGKKITEGVARTRKQAEQNAAREYLSQIKRK
ncbi:MAG: Ribonuclease 3 [Turneriella sp.]|nr:Ribonuclease 3 [Turneriella sp.]